MICPNCKENMPDGSKFCANCGTKLTDTDAAFTIPQPQNPLMQKKTIDTRVIFVGIAAIAVIFMAIILVVTHKKKINLNDYVTVVFEGYDSFGTASVDFDYDKLYKTLKDADSKAVCNDLSWELDKDSELSNGDTVTLSFSFDNDTAKKYGIKFVGKDKEFTVADLEKVKVIDPFKDIEVTFSGTAPNANAYVTNNSTEDVVQNLYFDIEPNYNLSKGDKVTVSVNADEEHILSEYGCKLSSTSKEYTCDNVDFYLTDGEELTEELLTNMKNHSLDTINAYFANNSKHLSASNKKYLGYYFLTNKEEGSWFERNIVYIVYTVKVKSMDKEFKDTTVYMPVKFTDALQYADGTQYVNMEYTPIQGRTTLKYNWWLYADGYETKTLMENELITAEKGKFYTAIFGDLK